jgi:hypothetical protein
MYNGRPCLDDVVRQHGNDARRRRSTGFLAPRGSQAGSLGSLPLAEAVLDDVRVTHRISALISAFGVLVSVMLLVAAVREYRSGASALWLVAATAILLSASYTLVRDARRLRTEPIT